MWLCVKIDLCAAHTSTWIHFHALVFTQAVKCLHFGLVRQVRLLLGRAQKQQSLEWPQVKVLQYLYNRSITNWVYVSKFQGKKNTVKHCKITAIMQMNIFYCYRFTLKVFNWWYKRRLLFWSRHRECNVFVSEQTITAVVCLASYKTRQSLSTSFDHFEIWSVWNIVRRNGSVRS